MSFFERYSKSQDNSAQARELFEKGEKYFESQEYDKAIDAYCSAISIEPNYESAYFNRAKAYGLKRQFENVINDCNKVVVINQKSAGGYMLRGIAYSKLNQPDNSIKDFSIVISMNSENVTAAYKNRAFEYTRIKQHDKSIDDYSKAIEKDPNDYEAYELRARVYTLTGDIKAAIDDCTKAIAINPNDSDAFTSRGLAYTAAGIKDEAVKDFRKASDLGDKTADEYLKEFIIDSGGQRVHSVDMNEDLWKDYKYFEDFLRAVSLLGKSASKESIDPKETLDIANMLDDIMQGYEKRYGPVNDPIFLWYFASANATFLQVGKEFDELGSARIGYIVNGYKEGLNKHLLYPSYSAVMIDAVFENMEQFANDHDKKWIIANRDKFVPISG